MTPEFLFEQIRDKGSFLCVGLDSDPALIPAHLRGLPDPILAFNREIIEATLPYAVAYKPNLAFYEALGPGGWQTLQETLALIPKEVMVIADAKRGDIGNTARMYAQAFFERLGCDALTVAPYMGQDSVAPFLAYEGKWTFLLALTSNAGAQDFQYLQNDAEPLYRRVIRLAQEWASGKAGQLGFVAGATRAEAIAEIRQAAPDAFLLVPGVGAQGGDLQAVLQHGRNAQGGLLINASRSILYAGSGRDFARQAAAAAAALQKEMAAWV